MGRASRTGSGLSEDSAGWVVGRSTLGAVGRHRGKRGEARGAGQLASSLESPLGADGALIMVRVTGTAGWENRCPCHPRTSPDMSLALPSLRPVLTISP